MGGTFLTIREGSLKHEGKHWNEPCRMTMETLVWMQGLQHTDVETHSHQRMDVYLLAPVCSGKSTGQQYSHRREPLTPTSAQHCFSKHYTPLEETRLLRGRASFRLGKVKRDKSGTPVAKRKKGSRTVGRVTGAHWDLSIKVNSDSNRSWPTRGQGKHGVHHGITHRRDTEVQKGLSSSHDLRMSPNKILSYKRK